MIKRKKPIGECKYGMFVHYVVPVTVFSNGHRPAGVDEAVDRFDAEGFAEQIAETGAEYLLLTAWQFGMIPLYPSPVTDRWRTVRSPRRDLLGEIVDGLNARGVQVVLYTHPRDGHDFGDEDRVRTGWGIGHYKEWRDQPVPENFDHDLWNAYVKELYVELADRYADRISGVYLDGMGPKIPWEFRNSDGSTQIVDYLTIRDIMKSRNPDLAMFQNFFGSLFSVDLANTEVYSAYVERHMKFGHVEKWHAARIATAVTAFRGSWGMFGDCVRGEYAPFMTPEDMARYTMFNASCSESGGVTWASGPFAEGNVWPVGVIETLRDTGRILAQFRESILDAVCSKSYPTVSGDTLEDRGYRFFMTGEGGEYEYLHCMRVPEDGVLAWGLPEDGVTLADPVPVHGEMRVRSFEKTGDGYSLRLEGTPNAIDTVIRFRRTGAGNPLAYEWINDTDKRIDYRDGWDYSFLFASEDHVSEKAKGCYDRDVHLTGEKTSLFFAFEGSFLEIYGIKDAGAGSAAIYIDGVYCGDMAQGAAKREARACCFRSPDLHGGWHILQLYANGDGTVSLDALKVIG